MLVSPTDQLVKFINQLPGTFDHFFLSLCAEMAPGWISHTCKAKSLVIYYLVLLCSVIDSGQTLC